MGTTEFDYVVVGAGTAGCVLANRLSADPGKSVLLLEAGGRDLDPWIHVPFAWGKILQERRNDWGFDTEREPGLSDRRLAVNRGKVLGGCSSVNAMAYVRGNPGDYDRWAASGLADWSYDRVLPYFKRSEHWERGGDHFRGDGGPVRTIMGRSTDPLHEAYRQAALAVGIPWTDDYNGAQNEGIGYAQHAIRDGRRESGATAYIKPIVHRKNLRIETGAHAHNILFEGRRAVGVRYERRGAIHEVRAASEVIVSAGTIKSPQLLMLSGIGPAAALRPHGLDVRIDLPGVGENLQDHLSAGVTYSRRKPGPIFREMRADRAAANSLKAILFGIGPMSILPTKYQAFVRTDPDQKLPDVQLLAGGATLGAHLWFPGIVAPYADAFSCGAAVLHPKSRGHLELSSTSPSAPMKIHFNFLSEPDDIAAIRRGIRLLRQIINRPEYDEFRGQELTPGPGVQDDAALDAYIRRTARTVYHPLGTCRMGVDDLAVVDAELKVKGADNLRVVDASIMPDLIGGNINAAVSMIAERASDLILAR